MQPYLQGFVDELVKQAASNPGAPQSTRRDYASSALISAASVPLLAIVGKKITRTLHNRAVREALENTFSPFEVKRLEGELHTGPLIGRARFDVPVNERPGLTMADLGSDVVKGALMGSVVQMIRDRFASTKRQPR